MTPAIGLAISPVFQSDKKPSGVVAASAMLYEDSNVMLFENGDIMIFE